MPVTVPATVVEKRTPRVTASGSENSTTAGWLASSNSEQGHTPGSLAGRAVLKAHVPPSWTGRPRSSVAVISTVCLTAASSGLDGVNVTILVVGL